MNPDRPPLLLRVAVVIGGAALLFGLVGLFLMLAENDAPTWGPGLRARVQVHGAPRNAEVAVEARWHEGDVFVTVPALRLGGKSSTFLLSDDVLDRRVELHAWTAGDGPSLSAKREVVVRRGDAIDLTLRFPAAAPATGR